MMELTMSRVCLFVCGAIMLAAVAAPVTGMLDDMEERDLSECADGIARLLDTFWDSEADVMTIRASEVLPDPGSCIMLDGHKVRLVSGDGEYVALSEAVSESIIISYGDTVDLGRSGGAIGLV